MEPVVFVLNGPNLDMLGKREPAVYGSATLSDIETRCRLVARNLGLEVDFRQSNHEGVLIDWMHEARDGAQGLIVNMAGLSHTSVAIQDAIKAADLPTIEVHLSNIHARESYRHHSYVSAAAVGVIVGLGMDGYEFALHALARRISRGDPAPTLAI